MKLHRFVAFALMLSAPAAVAMKNRQRHFAESCDVVWKAAVAVAKGQDYRVISIARDEQIISLDAGGFWNGERVISLSLAPDPERGCIATAQSRFSGLAHSDGPDLLSRIAVEIIGEGDRDSKAFRRFKGCVEGYTSNEKCEQRYRKDVAKLSKNATSADQHPDPSRDWWTKTDQK